MHIFTQENPQTGFRPYVKACPNKPADYAACIPEVFIPHAVVDGVASPVAAGSFVHEIGHLGHVYYALSAAHTKAGGIILGAFRHNEMRWQREGSAQFLRARAPDWAAYDRLGASACAFDALRQGAFKWKDFAPVGAAMVHPYQMSLLVDQFSWFHYKGGTDWLLDWWVARPDARDKTRPESAARALMRLLSPTAPVVDLSSLNLLLGRAAVDLAVRGRNPWTTRALNLECFDRGTIPISATAPGSVSVSVPPLAFRLATIPFELLAAQALDTLEIRLQTSQPAVRAAVYLIDVPGYVACVNALAGTALGEESPRKECNAKHVSVVGKLQAENGYKATLEVTAPSYVAVTAYRGSPQTGVVSGVKAGDEIAVNVKKPSDSGPVSAGSTTCKVSDAPSSPRITYSGSLRCSGF